MALLWMDGFEKYGTGNGVPINPTDVVRWKWVATFDERFDIYDGAYGGHSIAWDNVSATMMTPDLSPQDRTLIVGFNFKMDSVANSVAIITLRPPSLDGETGGYANLQFQIISVNSANQIQAAYNAPLTGNSTTTALDIQPATWYHFETKVYSHETLGTINLKINDVEVMSFTGDTQHRPYAESDRYSRVHIGDPTVFDRIYYDDFYVLDGTGSEANDFLGKETRVATLSPVSDASGNWTPSTGNDMYALVDEDTLDANYIENTTSGNQALFEMTNLSVNEASGNVQGIMASCDSVETANCDKYIKFISSNGAGSIEHTGNFAPGITHPLCRTQIMELDPDGNAWSAATINSLRAGVEVS